MTESLFWYDYETSGLDPKYDRIYQFAGLRTDLDLNPIEEPISLYCRPGRDTLPSPDACLVTGLSPLNLEKIGLPEIEFVKQIHAAFSKEQTCVLGYNTLRFDDEFTRFTFFRNFYDPYAREWQGGNSRWDVLGLVQIAFALRPEGIEWPKNEKGKISLRLEDLSKANGLLHEQAHDAMSDVYATIAMAKLIKNKQPKLYDYVFSNRNKHKVNDILWSDQFPAVVYCTSMVRRELGHLAIIKPLFVHKENKNSVLAYDLRFDPSEFLSLSVDEIKQVLFTRKSDSNNSNAKTGSAIQTIAINRCPVLVPWNTLTASAIERFDINLEQCKQNAVFLDEHPEITKHFQTIFNEPSDFPELDAEMALYSGGFIANSDQQRMKLVHALTANNFTDEAIQFDDQRLNDIFLRYKARNYSEYLSTTEREEWKNYCEHRLIKSEVGLNWDQFIGRINELLSETNLDSAKLNLLHEVKAFGESIMAQFKG